jgi:hypothetical protein
MMPAQEVHALLQQPSVPSNEYKQLNSTSVLFCTGI